MADKGAGKSSVDKVGASKAGGPGADKGSGDVSDRVEKGPGARGKGVGKEGGSKAEKKGKRKKSSADTGLYTVKKILQRKKSEGPKVGWSLALR